MNNPNRFSIGLHSAWLRLGVAGLTLMALSVTLPEPASANDYETCATGLLSAGIAPADAATVCARALQPQDVSTCVVRAKQEAGVVATEALSTCSRVRRPLELGTCIVDIRRRTQDAAIPEVLESCRRSLLPARFSECVVGLSQKIKDLKPSDAMNTCIDARDTLLNL